MLKRSSQQADIVNGGKTVVEAVAAGKVAAASMIAYLEKKGVK